MQPFVKPQAEANLTDNVFISPVVHMEPGSSMAFANQFKKSMKVWVKNNPDADEESFLDYCETLIPPTQYTTHYWLIDQARDWYKHVLSLRKNYQSIELQEVDGEI